MECLLTGHSYCPTQAGSILGCARACRRSRRGCRALIASSMRRRAKVMAPRALRAILAAGWSLHDITIGHACTSISRLLTQRCSASSQRLRFCCHILKSRRGQQELQVRTGGAGAGAGAYWGHVCCPGRCDGRPCGAQAEQQRGGDFPRICWGGLRSAGAVLRGSRACWLACVPKLCKAQAAAPCTCRTL